VVPGIDKIRIVKCNVIKKEIIKGCDGDFIVHNKGPVLFKKRQSKNAKSEEDDDILDQVKSINLTGKALDKDSIDD
jgi:hypothetical protein